MIQYLQHSWMIIILVLFTVYFIYDSFIRKYMMISALKKQRKILEEKQKELDRMTGGKIRIIEEKFKGKDGLNITPIKRRSK